MVPGNTVSNVAMIIPPFIGAYLLISYGILVLSLIGISIKVSLAMRYHTGFLSPLFEFHAWWHILAGIGTYLGIVFGADARLSVLGYKTKIKFWKRCFPYLVATDPLPH
ncbi:hypothetical protein MAR_013277 [Mya arenaria]|uniref:Alkaline ceramidase n=1 Tax=Mya arenaria TaxID=6604 RepID=A0ABY7FZD7_MYAAR|nr:hypothetical protein MAR_013277 [Mya arenaria]